MPKLRYRTMSVLYDDLNKLNSIMLEFSKAAAYTDDFDLVVSQYRKIIYEADLGKVMNEINRQYIDWREAYS